MPAQADSCKGWTCYYLELVGTRCSLRAGDKTGGQRHWTWYLPACQISRLHSISPHINPEHKPTLRFGVSCGGMLGLKGQAGRRPESTLTLGPGGRASLCLASNLPSTVACYCVVCSGLYNLLCSSRHHPVHFESRCLHCAPQFQKANSSKNRHSWYWLVNN